MKNFYTYSYLRKSGSPYYIGKGCGNRAYEKHYVPVPRDKTRVTFLYQNITEHQALAFEIFWIAVYGRKNNGTGILRNLTDGGEGISGYEHKKEARAKISSSLLGNRRAKGKNLGNRNGFKAGISSWNLGGKMTDAAKMKMSVTKSKYTYHTPKGTFKTKREMVLAFPEYTIGQIERFTKFSLKGFLAEFNAS